MKPEREDPEQTRRAPAGQERVSTLLQMRKDLRDWVDARAAAAKPPRSRNLEIEILLDEARLREAKGET